MRGLVLAIASSALLASSAAVAAPEEDTARQAIIAGRFQPFDAMTSQGWSAAFPFPFFRNAAAGESDSVSLVLKPGAYRVVVLCNCDKIDVALKTPANTVPDPDRRNDQGAMYSLDVPATGEFEISTTLRACQEARCDFAVKAYRKN